MNKKELESITETNIDHVDSNETKICEIAKHPIGIIIVYLQAFVGLIIAIGLTYFLLPSVIEDTDTAFAYANLFAALAIAFAVVVVLLSAIIYRQNRLIVTDRNITQILQNGLFNRKVSQLNLVNVEDVTSTQNGIIATIFGYGELKIETAGEQVNFHYSYCPNPGYFAKIILNAREQILGQNDEVVSVVDGSNLSSDTATTIQ